MMDVRRLRLLLELSRRGTITAVADALTYTPSAVSQQLAALEREAGVPLLERSGRRVALTSAGTVLARYAESVFALLEEASAALAATRTSLTGPLRIGAFPTAARTILPPALVALGRDHPGLELMVTELDPLAVPGALHAGTLDVALTFVYDYVPAEPDPALDSEPLLEEPVYLATGQDGPAETSIQDWRDARWIAGSPDTLCHMMVIRACQARGFTPRIRHYADDFATVLALVAAGQGVSLIPELGLTEAPGVTLTPVAARRRTSIACRKGTRDHPAVSAFATAIREQSSLLSGAEDPPPLPCGNWRAVRPGRCGQADDNGGGDHDDHQPAEDQARERQAGPSFPRVLDLASSPIAKHDRGDRQRHDQDLRERADDAGYREPVDRGPRTACRSHRARERCLRGRQVAYEPVQLTVGAGAQGVFQAGIVLVLGQPTLAVGRGEHARHVVAVNVRGPDPLPLAAGHGVEAVPGRFGFLPVHLAPPPISTGHVPCLHSNDPATTAGVRRPRTLGMSLVT
jgi:DNA-binding transcriptional LysR family regulator